MDIISFVREEFIFCSGVFIKVMKPHKIAIGLLDLFLTLIGFLQNIKLRKQFGGRNTKKLGRVKM